MGVERRLPAEWERQRAAQLTWPHAGTDWRGMLGEVTHCYVEMAREITAREPLLVVTPKAEPVRRLLRRELSPEALSRVSFLVAPTNDTWARDHSFITLLTPQGGLLYLDFRFNGWGLKYPSSLDNMICRRMWSSGLLQGGAYEGHLDFTLEGGSIDSDGLGTIMTTTSCLLAPNRNEPLGREEVELRLCKWLGARRVVWVEHGDLRGDDTDGHIDTLARFCPDGGIAYVSPPPSPDPHHDCLTLMEQQLSQLLTPEGRPYRLIPLPMAEPEYDARGQRLPATYANFFVINDAVLVPTYGHAHTDQLALEAIASAFPGRDIVPIFARPLLVQHGSLHCSTMQFPS